MRSNVAVAVGSTAALAVGLALGALLFGGSGSGSHSTTVSSAPGTPNTRPITLPATLRGFRDAVDVVAARGTRASLVASRRRNAAAVASATSAAYSKAFHGAAAAFRSYADRSLLNLPYVIAVRAAAPGLTVGPVPDARYLGLATAPREVKTVGPVQCQIDFSPPTVAGQMPPPSSQHVVVCQRSGPGLTVFVGGASFVGPQGLATMAELTNAAWTAAGR